MRGEPFLTAAAMCKLFAADAAEHITSLAVQLFGGYGYVKDYPVEKLYRDAKIGQIYEGTSNLQLQTIAKQILGVTGLGSWRIQVDSRRARSAQKIGRRRAAVAAEILRQHPGLPDRGHEVRITRPSRHEMDVKVILDSRAGGLARD